MRRMRTVLAAVAAAVAVAWAGPGAGRAAEPHGSGQGTHEGMGHEASGHGAAAPQGVLLREASVGGYGFTYRLLSWEERTAMMKGMEGHEMHGMDASGRSTHHLMLYVKGGDGKPVSGAQVGFVVVGPDKKEFKTLTMGMYDGYGADVPLKAPGVHAIRTKAVVAGKTLTDEFSYSAK